MRGGLAQGFKAIQQVDNAKGCPISLVLSPKEEADLSERIELSVSFPFFHQFHFPELIKLLLEDRHPRRMKPQNAEMCVCVCAHVCV